MIRHRIADDPAAVEVFEASQIEPAFIGGHVGNIADPCLVGTLDSKTWPQHIRGHRQGMARIRRRAIPAFLPAAQPQLAADAFDPMHAHPHPVRRQIALQPLGAIGPAGALVRGANLGL